MTLITEKSATKILGNHGVRQRITEQLKDSWEQAKNGRNFPNEADINIIALGESWQSCFLVKYDINAENNFSYIYLGEELIAAYGDEFHQREICEKLVFPSNNPMIYQFEQVVKAQNWVEYDDNFINSNHLLVRYRSIIMPLGKNDNNNNEIGFLLGAMRWKAYL